MRKENGDMELGFDLRGNLRPYEKITTSLDDFKSYFVNSFAGENQKRVEIFDNYLHFIQAIQQEITKDFIHWIYGSFVTRKTIPRDIDFVTLIDYKTYEKFEALIENKYRRQAARDAFGLVDAYVVKMYPSTHSKRWVSEYDLIYWRGWFSETRKNRAKKRFSKGFIEIQFGNPKVISDA